MNNVRVDVRHDGAVSTVPSSIMAAINNLSFQKQGQQLMKINLIVMTGSSEGLLIRGKAFEAMTFERISITTNFKGDVTEALIRSSKPAIIDAENLHIEYEQDREMLKEKRIQERKALMDMSNSIMNQIESLNKEIGDNVV